MHYSTPNEKMRFEAEQTKNKVNVHKPEPPKYPNDFNEKQKREKKPDEPKEQTKPEPPKENPDLKKAEEKEQKEHNEELDAASEKKELLDNVADVLDEGVKAVQEKAESQNKTEKKQDQLEVKSRDVADEEPMIVSYSEQSVSLRETNESMKVNGPPVNEMANKIDIGTAVTIGAAVALKAVVNAVKQALPTFDSGEFHSPKAPDQKPYSPASFGRASAEPVKKTESNAPTFSPKPREEKNVLKKQEETKKIDDSQNLSKNGNNFNRSF